MDEISGFQVIFLYLQYTNMAIKKNPHAKIFWKVAFSIILIVYFNILKSKVLVHFVDPTARFGRGVPDIYRFDLTHILRSGKTNLRKIKARFFQNAEVQCHTLRLQHLVEYL